MDAQDLKEKIIDSFKQYVSQKALDPVVSTLCQGFIKEFSDEDLSQIDLELIEKNGRNFFSFVVSDLSNAAAETAKEEEIESYGFDDDQFVALPSLYGLHDPETLIEEWKGELERKAIIVQSAIRRHQAQNTVRKMRQAQNEETESVISALSDQTDSLDNATATALGPYEERHIEAATKIQAATRGHQARKQFMQRQESDVMSVSSQDSDQESVSSADPSFHSNSASLGSPHGNFSKGDGINSGKKKPFTPPGGEKKPNSIEDWFSKVPQTNYSADSDVMSVSSGGSDYISISGSSSGSDSDFESISSSYSDGDSYSSVIDRTVEAIAKEMIEQGIDEATRLEKERQYQAAVKIQAAWRGWSIRKNATAPNDDFFNELDRNDPDLNAAATKIQAAWRGHAVRRNKNPGEPGTPNFPGTPNPDPSPEGVIYDKPRYHTAATKIQSAFRGFQGRQKAEQAKIQAAKRKQEEDERKKAQAEKVKLDEAATKIQAAARGFLDRRRGRKLRNEFEKSKEHLHDGFPKVLNRDELIDDELAILEGKSYRFFDGKFHLADEIKGKDFKGKFKENLAYSIAGYSDAKSYYLADKAEKEVLAQMKQEAIDAKEKEIRAELLRKAKEMAPEGENKEPKIDEEDIKEQLEEFKSGFIVDTDSESYKERAQKARRSVERKVGDSIKLDEAGIHVAEYDVQEDGLIKLQEHVNAARLQAKSARSNKKDLVLVKVKGDITEPELDHNGNIIYDDVELKDSEGNIITKEIGEGKNKKVVAVMGKVPRTKKAENPELIIHQDGSIVTQTFVKQGYIDRKCEAVAKKEFAQHGEEYIMRALRELPEDMDSEERAKKAAAMARSAIRQRAHDIVKQEIHESSKKMESHYANSQESMAALRQDCGDSGIFAGKKAQEGVSELNSIKPVTGPNGVSIAKNAKAAGYPYAVKVLFRNEGVENETGVDGAAETFDIAYVNIPETNCFVLARCAKDDGPMTYYVDGKPKSKDCKKGETVIDENTIFHLDRRTGNYVSMKVHQRRSNINMRKTTDGEIDNSSIAKSKNGIRGIKDYFSLDYDRVAEAYGKMSIQVVSQNGQDMYSALKLKGRARTVSAAMPKIACKNVVTGQTEEVQRRLPVNHDEVSLNYKAVDRPAIITKMPEFDAKTFKDNSLELKERAERSLCLAVRVATKDGPVVLNDGTRISNVKAGTRYVEPLPYSRASDGSVSNKPVQKDNIEKEYGKQFAQQLSKVRPATLIQDEIYSKEQEFLKAAASDDLEVVKRLLTEYEQRKSDIAKCVLDGRQIESDADLDARAKVMEEMMQQNNFDIFTESPRSQGSMNALHFAARNGNTEMADLLVKAGLDPSLRCSEAISSNKEDREAKEAALLAGLDPSALHKVGLGTSILRKIDSLTASYDRRKISQAEDASRSCMSKDDLVTKQEREKVAKTKQPKYSGATAYDIARASGNLVLQKKLEVTKMPKTQIRKEAKLKQFKSDLKSYSATKEFQQRKQLEHDLAQKILSAVREGDLQKLSHLMSSYKAHKDQVQAFASSHHDIKREDLITIKRNLNYDLTQAKTPLETGPYACAEGKDALQICLENYGTEPAPVMAKILIDGGFPVKDYHQKVAATCNMKQDELTNLGLKGMENKEVSVKYYVEITPGAPWDPNKRVFICAHHLDEDISVAQESYKKRDLIIDGRSIFILDKEGFNQYGTSSDSEFPPSIVTKFGNHGSEILLTNKNAVAKKLKEIKKDSHGQDAAEEREMCKHIFPDGEFDPAKHIKEMPKFNKPAVSVTAPYASSLKTGREVSFSDVSSSHVDKLTANNTPIAVSI